MIDYFNLPLEGESNLEKKVKKASSLMLAGSILVPASLGLLSQNSYAYPGETGKQEHKISIEEQKKKESFFQRLAKGARYIFGMEDEKNPSEFYTVQVLDKNEKVVQEYKHIDTNSKLKIKNIPENGMLKFISEKKQATQPQTQAQEKKTAVPVPKKDYTIYPLDVWVGDEYSEQYMKLKNGAEIEVPYGKTVFIKPQKTDGLTTEVMLLFPQKNLNLNDKYYTDDKGYIIHRTGPLAGQRVIIKNERIDLEEYGIRPLEEIFVDDTYETKTRLLQTVRIKLRRGPEPVPEQPVVTEETIEPPWNPEPTYPSKIHEKKKKHKEPKPEAKPEEGLTLLYLLGGKVERNFSGTCKPDVSLDFTSLRAAVEHAPNNNLLLTASVDADVDFKRDPCDTHVKSFTSVKLGAIFKPDGVPFGAGIGAGAEMQKNKTEERYYPSYFSVNSNNYFAEGKAGFMTPFNKDVAMYLMATAGMNYHTENNEFKEAGYGYDVIPLLNEWSWSYGAEGKFSVGRTGPVSLDVAGKWSKQTPMSSTIHEIDSDVYRPELGHLESWMASAMLSGRIVKNLSVTVGVGKGESKAVYKNGHVDKGNYTRALAGLRLKF